MISFNPRRKIGWSSTITMRVLSFILSRNRDRQTGAFAWRGMNVKRSAEQPNALGDPDQPVATGARRLCETASIVKDGEVHDAGFALQLENGPGGIRVL